MAGEQGSIDTSCGKLLLIATGMCDDSGIAVESIDAVESDGGIIRTQDAKFTKC